MGRSSLVILGGGFAGTTLARRLESRLPDDWDMTLLSQENCITYQPLLVPDPPVAHPSCVQEAPELARSVRVLELTDCPGFDLPDALAR